MLIALDEDAEDNEETEDVDDDREGAVEEEEDEEEEGEEEGEEDDPAPTLEMRDEGISSRKRDGSMAPPFLSRKTKLKDETKNGHKHEAAKELERREKGVRDMASYARLASSKLRLGSYECHNRDSEGKPSAGRKPKDDRERKSRRENNEPLTVSGK